jgi:hypothetical protein
MFEDTCIMGFFSHRLNVTKLHDLKHRAIRSGLWFSALGRIDRVLVDVTLSVAKSVRSVILARALYSVMKKLESAFQNRIWNVVHNTGFLLAHKLSTLAQNWGNCYAQKWAFDESFAKFLAIMHMNNVGVFEI